MLDRIPFGGTRGVMSHGDGESKEVGELGLDFGLPGITSATVAASGIGENQQLAAAGVALRTFLAPPVRDGMSGEGGRVMGNTDHQSAAVFVDIVDAVRDGDADGIGAEIVIVDAPRGAFPTMAGILEVAHQFAFLAVHADNRQMTPLETVAQVGEILELEIAVGADAGRNLLVI